MLPKRKLKMPLIKKNNLLIYFTAAFFAVEATIGVMMHTKGGRVVDFLKFSSIVFACLFCIIFAERSYSYLFTQSALVFTLISDYFLVLGIAEVKTVAMIFFSCAQICYFLRLYFEEKRAMLNKIHLIIRISASALILPATALVLGKNCDALALVSMFYYANLILNAIFAYIRFNDSPLFAIGLTLFILCDTVIGLSSLKHYLPIDKSSLFYKILHPGFDLGWAFYLPSQALLSASLLPHRIAKKEQI